MDYYGGVDETTFQMHGYGGFGYDTSCVKPDQKESIVVTAARQGNLRTIEQALNKENDPTKRRILLNGAKRWTEVDYKMSGFTKEYEWFGLTPLATTALKSHADVVEYLLKQGADPTLRGCPSDDIYYDAFSAANTKLKASTQHVNDLLSDNKTYMPHSLQCLVLKGNSAEDCAQGMLEAQVTSQLCVDMLEACKPYWKQARYSGSQYGPSREKSGYSNAPTDKSAMIEAVDTAKEEFESTPAGVENAQKYIDLVRKISAFRAKKKEEAEKAKKESAANNNKGKKKRKHGRYY